MVLFKGDGETGLLDYKAMQLSSKILLIFKVFSLNIININVLFF